MSNIYCDVVVSASVPEESPARQYVCTEYIRLVQHYPRLYKLCATVVNALSRSLSGILSCKMILQYLISFLYLFPEYKYTIYGLLRDTVQHIGVAQILEQNARMLLNTVLKDDSVSESYKLELTEKLAVKELLLPEKAAPVPAPENKPPTQEEKKDPGPATVPVVSEKKKAESVPQRTDSAKSLTGRKSQPEVNPKCGYALKVKIDAGATYRRIVEVVKPNSLLFCGFSIESEKLWYTIYKMEGTEKEWKVHLERRHCEAGKVPVKTWSLVETPGLYKVEWHNDDSWVNSRVIKYRIVVFEPLV